MSNLQKMTICLEHQSVEDQATPFGMVCPQCKHRLYTNPPEGNLMSFWESQPVAYSLKREPCFAYTLRWEDFRIRSIHLPEDDLVTQESPEIESHS
ncbi:MAG: hypothetical protein K0U86_24210 [Planctomycetes bacterium]|nr:hypothetical protein [Planctomycetota bacterium]MCH9728020.1 hypothetical protein [Planctomycetota bacterium]MCH9775822.1 hypothetical protein [Planctomycetota bacterium]MCH9793503.1 hypothetical protein [Planctomycetota bacterium]MDF1744674.1 hypothetical protein [Gimesia sp.]